MTTTIRIARPRALALLAQVRDTLPVAMMMLHPDATEAELEQIMGKLESIDGELRAGATCFTVQVTEK